MLTEANTYLTHARTAVLRASPPDKQDPAGQNRKGPEGREHSCVFLRRRLTNMDAMDVNPRHHETMEATSVNTEKSPTKSLSSPSCAKAVGARVARRNTHTQHSGATRRGEHRESLTARTFPPVPSRPRGPGSSLHPPPPHVNKT